MSGTGEDNSMLGRTFAHPKADLSAQPRAVKRPSVSGRMFLAVVIGAFFGYLLSILIAPVLAFAFMIGGAMAFGALAVGLMLVKPAPPDEYASGFARTDEEVRQALADIEARKK